MEGAKALWPTLNPLLVLVLYEYEFQYVCNLKLLIVNNKVSKMSTYKGDVRERWGKPWQIMWFDKKRVKYEKRPKIGSDFFSYLLGIFFLLLLVCKFNDSRGASLNLNTIIIMPLYTITRNIFERTFDKGIDVIYVTQSPCTYTHTHGGADPRRLSYALAGSSLMLRVRRRLAWPNVRPPK